MDGFEVLRASHEGYKTVYAADTWRVGLITPAERFENITYLERHNGTDEIFMLLRGRASLIGTDGTLELAPGEPVRAPRGCWHNIRMFEGAAVAVVEAADTSRENTDYMDYISEP